MLLSWAMNMRSLKTLICLEYILNLAMYLVQIELNFIFASSYFFYLNLVISFVIISNASTTIWSICLEYVETLPDAVWILAIFSAYMTLFLSPACTTPFLITCIVSTSTI